MPSNEEKQRARQHRERKFRLWLTTLSWTMPVIAFGSFFSIWHNISSALTPPAKSTAVASGGTNHPTSNVTAMTTQSSETGAPSVLFQAGSRGPQVSAIQEQLRELGYFNHVVTGNYGQVTAQAVQSFQMAQHLNATGEIDSPTLNALKQAVKDHKAANLLTSGTSSAPSRSSAAPQGTSAGSVVQSQQSVPQTSTSASHR